jgi:hypothetical protein
VRRNTFVTEPDSPGSLPGQKAPAPAGGRGNRPRGGSPGPVKTRWVFKAAAAAIIIVMVIGVASFSTIRVNPDLPPAPGARYPYTTTYEVIIPVGREITVGGTPILILSTGDVLLMKIGNTTEQFTNGQTKTISERTARITTLGFTILETGYMIEATYRGMAGDQADFYLVVRTSNQVPQFLLGRLLPPEVTARPV